MPGLRQRLARRGPPPSRASSLPSAHLQGGFSIELVHPLVIDHQVLLPQQHAQPPIAKRVLTRIVSVLFIVGPWLLLLTQ
jgi:hypothetical protein